MENTNQSEATSNQRELSFGEKAVGLKFNPSNNDSVGQIKQKFANIIDVLN